MEYLTYYKESSSLEPVCCHKEKWKQRYIYLIEVNNIFKNREKKDRKKTSNYTWWNSHNFTT